MLRKLFAPIVLRFHSTESLLAALDMVERSYTGQKSSVSEAELEFALRVIGRERLRREVIFWV